MGPKSIGEVATSTRVAACCALSLLFSNSANSGRAISADWEAAAAGEPASPLDGWIFGDPLGAMEAQLSLSNW